LAQEIERKYLVAGTSWRAAVVSRSALAQGYLAHTNTTAVRVRIVDHATAFLTIKSASAGMTRSEFEYEIPLPDARTLMAHCDGVIVSKQRHVVSAGPSRQGADLFWEIDVYEGDLAGLVTAEIELPSEDAHFEMPEWLGREVTDDKRYYNAALASAGLPDFE